MLLKCSRIRNSHSDLGQRSNDREVPPGMNRLRAGQPMKSGLISLVSTRAAGRTQPLVQWIPWVLSRRAKRPGCEIAHCWGKGLVEPLQLHFPMPYRLHRGYFTLSRQITGQDLKLGDRSIHLLYIWGGGGGGASAQIDRSYITLFSRFLDHTHLHACYGTQDQPDSEKVSYTTRNKYK